MGNAHTQRAARDRIKRRAAGTCIKCPNRATHGDKCRKHWEKYKVAQRKYRVKIIEKRRAAGLCTGCGIPLDPESDAKTHCCNCVTPDFKQARGRNKR
jgi:hypothetical protein